jgi:hypothetical protein
MQANAAVVPKLSDNKNRQMSFETNFRLISYFTVFCGFLSLWISGTFE